MTFQEEFQILTDKYNKLEEKPKLMITLYNIMAKLSKLLSYLDSKGLYIRS